MADRCVIRKFAGSCEKGRERREKERERRDGRSRTSEDRGIKGIEGECGGRGNLREVIMYKKTQD
jgi:hypothetical protein